MPEDPRIHELRRVFATHASLNEVGWNQRTGRTVTLSAALSTRRRMREFRRVLFLSQTFHNLLQYSDESKDGPIVLCLMFLKIIASSTLSRKGVKEIRDIYLQAEKDAKVTVRVLLQMASDTVDQENKDMFLLVAQQIEHTPHLSIENTQVRNAASCYDFRLIGQKGDRRAFLIKSMGSVVPLAIPNRNAMIRDLLKIIGVRVDGHHVRSTLLDGHT